VQEEEHHGDGQRRELQPVLERLHECDRTHAAESHVAGHHDRYHEGAQRVRAAGDGLEGEARALHLRHKVEPADEDDEKGGDRPEPRGAEAQLAEVRQVNARDRRSGAATNSSSAS
jgi:hypothetical protein